MSDQKIFNAEIIANWMKQCRQTYANKSLVGNAPSHEEYVYTDEDFDWIIRQLGYKPCGIQWHAAGLDIAPDKVTAPFGETLKSIIEKYDLSPQKIAESVHRSRNTIYRWMNLHVVPDKLTRQAVLGRLCDYQK